MKIFNKKNLKKALTYTAVAIGGAVITTVAFACYGKKLNDRETEIKLLEKESLHDEYSEIMDIETEA